MKIAIFGGSFNPIHKGHIKIAKDAIKFLNLDKLIFVPCQKNPFKKNLKYANSEDRINMIKNVIEDKMEISTFEIKRKGLSYTIDTIKYFKNLYKNDSLYFLIGSDNLLNISKWKNIDEMVKMVQFVVFKRDKNINKINIKKYKMELMNNQIYDESSSEFLSGFFEYVDTKNLEYIGKRKIYFDDILKSLLDDKRYIHSKNARDFAIEIAKKINFNIEQASFAAYVHDIAKNLANNNKEQARKIIREYEPNNENIEDYKLHQELGYIILKHIFKVEENIVNAVRVHTSLSLNLSTLDKIVFIADKLCKGRKYKGIQEDRKLCFENFDEGFKNVVKKTYQFNLSKGITFTKEQEKIYQKWMN